MAIQTLSELFLVAMDHNKPDCILHKVAGSFQPISSRDLSHRVRRLAAALEALGVQPGDRVALMAENGLHWPIVDFATLGIGGILVPIYPTLTSDQAAYIANDCGAHVLFVQGAERLEALLEERGAMPQVDKVILVDGQPPEEGVLDFSTLLEQTSPLSEDAFEQRARRCQPHDLATFIYTSGTTGNPKGVMLTHGNIASNVVSSLDVLLIKGEHTALSFLPLSHSFERTVDYIYFYQGTTIAYAESVQAVPQNLQEVNPHVFVSVPRVYEKMMAKVQESVASSPPLRQKIFNWAESVAKQSLPFRIQDRRPGALLGLKVMVADKLVFSKIRQRLGNRFEFAVSGGAPLARDLAEFFWGMGIKIYEGYGLSETSPVLCVNPYSAVKLGTVGPAIPGVEFRIAEDGEILARGPNIMKGYFNMPEATSEAIDSEGWFHTGDIGELDDDGYLKITDRKKELIVNAYGKNVAPAPIENRLKSSTYIGQVIVLGDRRKLLAALLVPDFEALTVWAENKGLRASDIPTLIENASVRELFESEIEKVNKKLARYEQIHLWELLPEEFTIEGGELTPTQKIKRRVIHKKYTELIDNLYEAAESSPERARA